jgi:hypothetical protein
LSSCSFFERTDDILLARVGDSYLYKSDLDSYKNSGFSNTDSLAFVEQYIQNWAKEELLLEKALLNINQEELEIEKRIEDYRRSLLIHAYEQRLIQQSLDTLIQQQSLNSYYNQHSDDYVLAEKIVKVMFVKASNMAPKLDSLQEWVFDKDSIEADKIEAYCHQYAKRFYYNADEWLTWSDFKNVIPSEFDISILETQKNTMSLKDSLDVYLIRLYERQEQGEIAPIEYVQEEIKSILLNQQKLKTIDRIQSKLLEDAKQLKQFEVY